MECFLFQSGPGGDHCSQLSAKFLAKFVQRVFTDEWSLIQIGLHLDLPPHQIEVIKTDNRNNIRMAGYTLMNQWMLSTTVSTQQQRLILAGVLIETGMGKAAEDLGLLVHTS